MGNQYETYGCEFKFAVSAIFLFPVWPETAVGGLFFPEQRVLRCVVARRPRQSAADVSRRPDVKPELVITRPEVVLRRPEVAFSGTLQRLRVLLDVKRGLISQFLVAGRRYHGPNGRVKSNLPE